MKRWLAMLLLLASCNGCMMFDDVVHGEPWMIHEGPPPNNCAAPSASVNAGQTAEPPR